MCHQTKRQCCGLFIYTFSYWYMLQKCKYAYSSYCPGSSSLSFSMPWTSFQGIAEPCPGPVKWLASPSDGSVESIIVSLGHYCWAPSSKATFFSGTWSVFLFLLTGPSVYVVGSHLGPGEPSRHPRDGWQQGRGSLACLLLAESSLGEGSWDLPMKESWNWAPVSDAAVILGLCQAQPDLYAN